MISFCALLILMIIIKPQKILNIKILRCSVKTFARRQMDAALGVLRLRPKSLPLQKMQAIPIIRKILKKVRKTIYIYL